jgi:DNA-directed RNA polymerase subunit RPC12/RpoP
MQTSSVNAWRPQRASVPAPPQPPDVKAALTYRCGVCQAEAPLEENVATMCFCGWRILTKVQRKETRSFATD